MYTNLADVTGQEGSTGNAIDSIAHATGNVFFLPNGLVLGDSTSTVNIATSTISNGSCTPLLSTSLRAGMRGAGVTTLQNFLNQQGSNIPATGFFGPMTTAAVKNFQLTYASDILAPLGLSKPTGSVFSATLGKINQLACGSSTPVTSVTSTVVQNVIKAAVQGTSGNSKIVPKVSKHTMPKTDTAPVITVHASSSTNASSWLSSLFNRF
jgi:peptidoglycan hydrolase-like protein with peptidoglycan-binding domain